jgi:hypothetical protein
LKTPYKLEVTMNDSAEIASDALDLSLRRTIDSIAPSSKAQKINMRELISQQYNLTLSFVRLVANSATVTAGLIMGAHVSPERALMIGLLTGALSGAIQLKSDAMYKWLSNSVWLVNSAKKLGLIKDQNTTQAEAFLKNFEMYGRWGSIELGFLAVIQTSMALLNIPITENIFLTTAKSTASQGVFEVGILKATEQLSEMNPKWAAHSAIFKNAALFAGSGVSVLAAIGSLSNMPYANLGFETLTAAGLVLTFGPKLAKSAPVAAILERCRGQTSNTHRLLSAVRCEALF